MPAKTLLKPSDYVHLHTHTEYSVLDGLTKIKPLMKFVASEGMESVAITDHGNLSGAIEFYKEAKEQSLKPIIGIETYVATRSHTDKEPSKDKQRFHLILMAMNETGYKNLMYLSSIANLEGFYYYPRVDHKLIEEHNEGLICLSGCMSGELGDAIKQGQLDEAREIAKYYKKLFGDRYYLEVQDHGHPKNPMHSILQQTINDEVFKIAAELGIEVVVTCDSHYLKHEDQEAHEILLCVGTLSYFSDTKRMTLKDFPLNVTPPSEIIDRWGKEHPDVITNTRKIADRCNLTINLGSILIPKFEVPKGKTEKSFLHEQVYQGLAWRYGGQTREKAMKLSVDAAKKLLPKEILERTTYELSVIENMGFSGYFLIVSDMVNWGKDQGIVFGPGRGSAAGSIISYSLRITELDPLYYDLLFERFLNPDRISMPDIDIDIQDNRREEVINYCIDKYGKDRVANIATFGRMFARNAVRDVARVLEVSYVNADRLAKMIPQPIQGRHVPLEVSIKEDSDLKAEYANNEESKKVLDLAMKLEGTVRSHGVHAAGIVIAPGKIVSFVPLEMAQKGVVSTQYSLGPIEELGLLKMDLLGLSNLTTIKNTLRIIKKVYGKDIDISKIPFDDKKTFKLFQLGDTTGIFQFESAGMKRYLKDLKPTVFEDIIAMGALYRPGPMQWIDDFISRKNGKKKVEYVHDSMKDALVATYGVMVYQEQVMQISKDMCGFTGGQADTLRKAIAKKKPEQLAKIKSDFIQGAIKTVGADKKLMEKFWTQLEAFAAYCFPKSHAACYAVISYQTAYLKAHYPEAYMSALLTGDYDNIDRLAIEITECQHMGIEVLPPDINESFAEFAVVPGTKQIRFGLPAIKNVGANAVAEILRAREDGSFTDLEDFFRKVNTRTVNHKSLESLIKAGAFDKFGERDFLLHNLDNLLTYASRIQKDILSGQTDLFGSIEDVSTKSQLKLNKAEHLTTKQEKLVWERELLGLYLSEHPLEAYRGFLAKQTTSLSHLSELKHNDIVTVGGVVTVLREITTKNGQKMAFVQLEDELGGAELIFFPQVYQGNIDKVQRDKVLMAKGKFTSQDKEGNLTGDNKILVEAVVEVIPEDVEENGRGPNIEKYLRVSSPVAAKAVPVSPRLFIRLESTGDEKLLMSIKQTIDQHHGSTDVVLVLGPTDNKQIIKLPIKIDTQDKSIEKLKELVGADNIKLS